MSLYSFSPSVRIRCAADYKCVFDGALFKVHQPHFLFLAKVTEQPHSRLGIVVAKKKVRRAHERNRIKRLARESFRLHQQLQFAWQKLQRLVKKHHKIAPSSSQN